MIILKHEASTLNGNVRQLRDGYQVIKGSKDDNVIILKHCINFHNLDIILSH